MEYGATVGRPVWRSGRRSGVAAHEKTQSSRGASRKSAFWLWAEFACWDSAFGRHGRRSGVAGSANGAPRGFLGTTCIVTQR